MVGDKIHSRSRGPT